MTAQKYTILLLTAVIIGLLLYMGNCSGDDHGSAQNKIETLEADNARLDAIANNAINECKVLQTSKDSLLALAPVFVDRWHAAAKNNREEIKKNICDSVRVLTAYDNTVRSCDSLHRRDSLLNVKNDKLIGLKDVIIATRETQLLNKDTIIDKLKGNNRQLLFVGLEPYGNLSKFGLYGSVILDTKKGAVGYGYDPFNKLHKVSVYAKLKLWKRKH